MYKEFYNLQLNPFEISPDPFFLFLARRHQEALAALYYGVDRRKGFVALTGDVGTGKTLLIRCLLHMLTDRDIACAYVFNSRLSTLEFLQYVATELGLAVSSKTKGEILQDLRRYLVARHHPRGTTVIVVDDAQELSTEVLEEIRLLTNLETDREKLLQILLVGQPELDDKLDSFKLRQLKQRIALRCRLEPFDLEETRGYIQHRLQLAGFRAAGGNLFDDDAIERVYCYSQGVARLVNTICDNALITAFARQLNGVSPNIIDEVAFDLRLPVARSAQSNRDESQHDTLQVHNDALQLDNRLQDT